VAAAGGRDNAFTSRDYTAYFQQVHKSKLSEMMRLEADRMANLVILPEEFAKEIRVVMEERRTRTEDEPHALVYETLSAIAYQSHPYHHPVIGWMADLESMKHEDALAWYKRWYAPNNAVVVVVGDVDTEVVFRDAAEIYGGIAPQPLPARKPQHEPPQRGIKRATVRAQAELPYLMLGFKAPVLRDVEADWEPYALSVLAAVLDGHDSARLNRHLVREQLIASQVGASFDMTARGPGLFLLDATPAEGKTTTDVEKSLRAEIESLQHDLVSERELRRVKAQAIAGQVYKRDSIFAQAMEIGQTETAGIHHSAIDRMLDKLKEVSAEQVREVARKYLIDLNLSVVELDPQRPNKVSE
jgi:zinc protease